MTPFDLAKAQALLDGILEDHEALSLEARGFGLRMAAPKGLMSLSEAQRIVTDFAQNTAELESFVTTLGSARGVPQTLAADFVALRKKAEAALDQFHADLKKAQDALEKHEDALVGSHFQEAYEAVRHAILDLDLVDDVDIDFKTHLYLDKDPAYGMGTVLLIKGTSKVFEVQVGYRAVDDQYWGAIKPLLKSGTLEVVRKKGKAHLPKFVRELVGQLKALNDHLGTGLFRSRKKVDLTLDMSSDADVTKGLSDSILKHFHATSKSIFWQRMQGEGSHRQGVLHVPPLGRNYTRPMLEHTLRAHVGEWEAYSEVLTKPFVVTVGSQSWRVQPRLETWRMRLSNSHSILMEAHSWSDIEAFMEKNYPESLRKKRNLNEWRALALKRGIDPTPFGRSGTDIQYALMQQDLGPTQFSMSGTIFVTAERQMGGGKTSAQRVAHTYLTAGGDSFYQMGTGADVAKAFRHAVTEARYEYGSRRYTGSLAEKQEYTIRSRDPRTKAEAYKFAQDDIERNNKWGPAFAIPVTEEKVLQTEKVTVTVEARNEADALRQGRLRIKATGRVPPKATILVDGVTAKVVAPGARVSTYEVTGTRKQVVLGDIKGWLFYGMASS